MDFQPSQIPVDKHHGSQKNAIWKVLPHVQTQPCVFHRQLTGYTICTIVLLLQYFVSIISVHDFKWYHIVKQIVYARDKLPDPHIISYQIKTNHASYVSNISRVYHYDPQLYSLNPLVVNSPQPVLVTYPMFSPSWLVTKHQFQITN
jgi:hypothetical protein